MPEPLLFIIITVIALLGMVVMSWGVTIGPRPARPDPLEESAAAQRAARTAADTARASARAANAAELDAFDATARRILDALDVPCVCSQVLTHEWDEHTQSHRQRWTVPEHFTACLKHWPAATGAPPRTATAQQQRQGGPMLTPAARVNAAHRAIVAEWARRATGPQQPPRTDDEDYTTARAVDAWARQITDRPPMSRGAIDAWERQITGRQPTPRDGAGTRALPSDVTFEPYPARRTPGGVPYRAPAAITTYGVPADCTCVPAHAHAALANTHVRHRVGCAARHEPRARDLR